MTNATKTRAKRVKAPEPSEAGARTVVYQEGLLPQATQEAPEKPAKGKAAQVKHATAALEKKKASEGPVPANDTPEVSEARAFLASIPSIKTVQENGAKVTLDQMFAKKKLSDAKWFPLGNGRILVAALSNDEYERKIQETLTYKEYEAFQKNEYEYLHETGRCANMSEVNRLIASFFVGTVFLDAEGLELDGEPWEFNEENAIDLMLNETFQQFLMVAGSSLMKENLESQQASEKN